MVATYYIKIFKLFCFILALNVSDGFNLQSSQGLQRLGPRSAHELGNLNAKSSLFAEKRVSDDNEIGGRGGSQEPVSLRSEFLMISLPALVQLTAEPLASLVDTYYLSKLGSSVLGGAGVAITGGYALGKVVGDPVLRCCIR
jgi:hypothetical protein